MKKTTKYIVGISCFVILAAVYLYMAFHYTKPCPECEKKTKEAAASAPDSALPTAK